MQPLDCPLLPTIYQSLLSMYLGRHPIGTNIPFAAAGLQGYEDEEAVYVGWGRVTLPD